ncbi:Nickel uptake substrate-specific transmembrane region [compost metagenome]
MINSANAKKGASLQAKITSEGKVVPNAKVSVFSSTGWGKEFVADANGVVTFDALWAGAYVLEASTFVEKAGEHEGKPYASSWQGSTTFFAVK